MMQDKPQSSLSMLAIMVVVAFFFNCDNFGRMFDHLFSACALFFFFVGFFFSFFFFQWRLARAH